MALGIVWRGGLGSFRRLAALRCPRVHLGCERAWVQRLPDVRASRASAGRDASAAGLIRGTGRRPSDWRRVRGDCQIDRGRGRVDCRKAVARISVVRRAGADGGGDGGGLGGAPAPWPRATVARRRGRSGGALPVDVAWLGAPPATASPGWAVSIAAEHRVCGDRDQARLGLGTTPSVAGSAAGDKAGAVGADADPATANPTANLDPIPNTNTNISPSPSPIARDGAAIAVAVRVAAASLPGPTGRGRRPHRSARRSRPGSSEPFGGRPGPCDHGAAGRIPVVERNGPRDGGRSPGLRGVWSRRTRPHGGGAHVPPWLLVGARRRCPGRGHPHHVGRAGAGRLAKARGDRRLALGREVGARGD